MTELNRREFFKAVLGGGALAASGGVGTLYSGFARAAAPAFDDYKALVVFYLYGGNDAYNMVIPMGSGTRSYDEYANSRGAIAVANKGLTADRQGNNPYAAGGNSDAEKYLGGLYTFDDYVAGLDGYRPETHIGINAMMPELAQLYRDGRAASVVNVGSLVEPVTKNQLGEKKLPPFLFAHNHQTRAMETGWADNLSAMGWAGRLADLWEAHTASGVNGGSALGLNVSFGGNSRLMTGRMNAPSVLSPSSSRLFDTRQDRFDADFFRQLNRELPDDHPLHRVLRSANRRSVDLSNLLSGYYADTEGMFGSLQNPYGGDLFSSPDAADLALSRGLSGQALRSFHAVARMIHVGRNQLGLNRQIFFVGMGGFDNHTDLASKHPLLLREISLALNDFTTALDDMNGGIADEVLVASLSDFGRTLGNNGDGTDHAWAGCNILLGGGIDGGRVLGELPDLRLGGDSDTASNPGRAKGRLIPTTAIDQYLATLCDWFGVAENEMAGLFPNLSAFEATPGEASSAYLALNKAQESGLPLSL